MRRPSIVTSVLVLGGLAIGVATGIPTQEKESVAVWRPAVADDSVARSITEAELQGRRHPRSAVPAKFERAWEVKASVGRPERRCVIVGNAQSARSGEIIGTPFRVFADYWRRGAPPKLSWAGAHRPRIGEPIQLTIKASRLDGPAGSYVFLGDVTTYRWSAVAMAKLMRIQWRTAAVIDPPSSGRWLLVTSLGQDWGCFVVELPPVTGS